MLENIARWSFRYRRWMLLIWVAALAGFIGLQLVAGGAYSTDFYREIRDLLHQEVNVRGRLEGQWAALAAREGAHRSTPALGRTLRVSAGG